MNFFEADIIVLILFLLAANLIGILLIAAEERFWLPGILIWMALFVFFVILREANRKELEYQDFTTSQTPVQTDEKGQDPSHRNIQLEQAENEAARKNNIVFTLLGWQSIFCFVSALLGFAKTNKNYYKSAMLAFLLLSLIYVLLVLLD